MDPNYDEISEAEMAKKMRKRLKRTFNEAIDAHDGALKSESAIAKYNSGILRDLEAAFASDPKVNLLAKLPANYAAALEELRKDVGEDSDRLRDSQPLSKRLKPQGFEQNNDKGPFVPDHLRILQGPGDPDWTSITDSVVDAFQDRFSTKNIIKNLAECEILSRDQTGGDRMVLKLNGDTVVKIVPESTYTGEYETLTFLGRQCPGVPIAEPKGRFTLNGQVLMFMSYVPGETLDKAWDSLTPLQKTGVSAQLDVIFDNLRSFPCEDTRVWGAIDGSGCIDRRRSIRPADSEIRKAQEFEDFFFSKPKYGSEIWITFLRNLYKLPDDGQDSEDEPVLTHGDLQPANTIVQRDETGEVKVAAIIDWECSGFYPAYWEAIKMTNCMGTRETSDWFLHLPGSVSPQKYPKKWLVNLVWDSHVD